MTRLEILHKSRPSLLFLFALIFTSTVFIAIGDNNCDKITDADEKIKCLEDRIEDKEEEYESLSKQLSDIQSKKTSVSSKISALGSQLDVTQDEIDDLNNDIKELEKELDVISKNLEERKKSLQHKIELRNHVLRNYSKKASFTEIELFLLSPSDATNSGFGLSYLTYAINKATSQEFIKLIQALNGEISGFEKDKAETEEIQKELKAETAKLVNIKADLDKKKAQAQNEFKVLDKKEDDYEDELEDLGKEIEELSKKQQAIINEKNGEGNGTVGDYSAPSSKTPDPPFKPAFAAFSYGAYTHYNGMSQYGAKGRAEDGDNYKEILKFYYKVDVEDKSDFPKKISVQGIGEVDFQYYLYGIAEMPSDWPMEALKAQAIAARTYAYKSGKPICTTEACQVFLKSKADNPPSRWKEAVDATKGKILKDSKTSQYSSTTGGYINNVGWDIDGKWPNDAYEKKAGSPWFYKAWYTKGYSGKDNCGRSHPWLSEKEMADILNAWVVWRKGSGDEKDRISPVTTSCWGGNPYSNDEMASKADKYGEKYTSVSSVDVEISNNGYTTKVKLQTNRGSVSMDGEVFKTVFNLRAPGYVAVRSRLFDLEKR